MKLARPQWDLLIYILPPIFSTLAFIIFFPMQLFQFLIGIVVFSVLLGSWLITKNLTANIDYLAGNALENTDKIKGTFRWIYSLFGLIFLLGISSVFFIFLTAASQLSPEKLVFGKIAKIWYITFPVGICLLLAQIVMFCISPKSIVDRQSNLLRKKNQSKFFQLLYGKDTKATEKMLLSSQVFLRFSGFVVLVISLSIVILSITNGLARWIGFVIPSGVQLQTIIGSTLLYVPFAAKYWRKRRSLKVKYNRSTVFFSLTIGLISAIALLSFLTSPLAGLTISVQFLSYGLTFFQWELFILAWWIGIIPLVANQIIRLSVKRSLTQLLIAIIMLSSCVYSILSEFLTYGGEEYFLTVVREGILALILTALPIGGLILMIFPLQSIAKLKLIHFKYRKQFRDQGYITHSIIQATVIACVLYWVSGLSILFVLLLMVTVPWLMQFLFTEMTYTAVTHPAENLNKP